jgi:acetylglutamate kinase
MKKLNIIKIGGNIINDPVELENFLADFSALNGLKLLVHGGGKLADELAAKLGISQALINGRRITDAETLKVITMIYGGAINKNIVASLQSKGINALGLSGADGNSIVATKRAAGEIDFGFVGDIISEGVNTSFISSLLASGITPVFSPITHDGKGQLLNTNADTVASALAIGLSSEYEVNLHYCFEKKGVLANPENEKSLISSLDKSKYKKLISEGMISRGMIPKLDNAFDAKKKGVASVCIAKSNDLIKLINENTNCGTIILN